MAGSILYTGTASPKHGFHRLTALQAFLNPAATQAQIKQAIDTSVTIGTIVTNVDPQNLIKQVDLAINDSLLVKDIATDVKKFKSLTPADLKQAVDDSKEIGAIKDLVKHEALKGLLAAVLDEHPKIQAIKQSVLKIQQTVSKGSDCTIATDRWEILRKGFQLLNRLEDWVLADKFDGVPSGRLRQKPDAMAPEFQQEAFKSMLAEFINRSLENNNLQGLSASINSLFEELHQDFPKQDDATTRAGYYCKLISARSSLIQLFSQD